MTNGSLPGQYTERLSASAAEINLVSIHFGPVHTNHSRAAILALGGRRLPCQRTIRVEELQRLSSSRTLQWQHAPAFADSKQAGLPTTKVCLFNSAIYADTGPLRHLKAKSFNRRAGRQTATTPHGCFLAHQFSFTTCFPRGHDSDRRAEPAL